MFEQSFFSLPLCLIARQYSTEAATARSGLAGPPRAQARAAGSESTNSTRPPLGGAPLPSGLAQLVLPLAACTKYIGPDGPPARSPRHPAAVRAGAPSSPPPLDSSTSSYSSSLGNGAYDVSQRAGTSSTRVYQKPWRLMRTRRSGVDRFSKKRAPLARPRGRQFPASAGVNSS